MTSLVLLVENLLFPFAAAAMVLRFALSARRGVLRSLGGELRERLGGLSGESAARLSGRKVLWVHAASAGEVAAAAPLIQQLAARPSKPAVLVTTTTAVGRERALKLPVVAVAALAPLDFGPAVGRFLRTAKPSAVILIETELWPHLIELSARSGAALALVNARISDRSLPRYRLIRPFLRPLLSRLSACAAQTDEDARRLAELGAPKPSAVGNMKYDLVHDGDEAGAAACIARLGWNDMRILTAASTHPGEEEAVLTAFAEALGRHSNLRLVLAPRHVERAQEAEGAALRMNLTCARWSRPEAQRPEARVLVLDAFGILPSFFPRSFATFVGGTLVPVGGHNVLEPALAGSPVIFGPNVQNTAQTARLLESAGGGFCAEDGARLAELLEDLLRDPARSREQGRLARKAAESLQGATTRTLQILEPLLQAAGI